MQKQQTKMFLSACLPGALYDEMDALDLDALCEIRLRANRPAQFRLRDLMIQGSYTPTPQDIALIGEALCEHALYARYDETRRGFVTLRGGHRMGLCGRVLWEKDEALALCDIASLAIRIAREVRGAAAPLMKRVKTLQTLPSVLILGGPGTGKTTLLRDYVRMVSQNGVTVGLNDERGELAACQNGVPQLDVGVSTDVLDGCQKAYGIRWLIRSMSPVMIATDELAGMEDAMAILDARASGIRVAATVHAGAMSDLDTRSDLRVLCHQKVFDLYVLLKNGETGVIESFYDREGAPWH